MLEMSLFCLFVFIFYYSVLFVFYMKNFGLEDFSSS